METAEALPVRDDTAGEDGALSDKPAKRGIQNGKGQGSALTILRLVSSYLDADEDLHVFLGHLCEAIALETRAARVAFWRLGPRGILALQEAPFGFDNLSPIHGIGVELGPSGEGAFERLIVRDELDIAKGTSAELDAVWREAGLQDTTNSIAAPWCAGDRRIGAVVAYNSPHGFTAQDVWLLRVAGMATGLLWQYTEAEDDLGQTAVRLEEAMTARRHLLNNIAAGGEEARRRFASALHDDSLQLLTGAELQLERIRTDTTSEEIVARLEQMRQTLRKVEDSLRRLLTNVSPEPLPMPTDLRAAISERLEELRVRAGIEYHVDYRLIDEIPQPTQAIVMKNVGEALNNVEKHASATRVAVLAETVDGGIRVGVADDGTGFVVAESVRVPGHIGLVALRERAQLAGGTCRIESDPGTGTKIEFWVPMTL